MKKAYYMIFHAGDRGTRDRVGGLPSHLPKTWPICEYSGENMGFIGKFYCSPERLNLPGIRCLQIYQCIDSNDDPIPIVLQIPLRARVNLEGLGTAFPGILPHDVLWEERSDPDIRPSPPQYDESEMSLTQSKVGGTTFFTHAVGESDSFLLQLQEFPADIKFGGYTLVLSMSRDGIIKSRLA